MKTFAHHYVDTPHGESHAPISISVLLTLLFIGAQGLIFVLIMVAMNAPTIYSGSNPFTATSILVAALLMVFLLVDFRRNRLEAHGRQQFQFVVFGLAAALLVLFAFFMVQAMQFATPLG